VPAPRPQIDTETRQLALWRDGRFLLFDVSGDVRLEINAPELLDFGFVGGEVWLVHRGEIERVLVREGRSLGRQALEHLDPSGSLLIPGSTSKIPIWLGNPPRLLILRGGEISAEAPGVEAELVIPLDASKLLAWSAGQLRLWRAIGDAWRTRAGDPGTPVAAAQLILDGRMLVLVQQRPSSTESRLTVVSTRDGVVHTSLKLPRADDLRFAPRRGALIIRDRGRDSDLVRVIDLRFGRVVREFALPEGTRDFAVDDALQVVAVITDDAVALARPDDLAAAARPARPDDDEAPELLSRSERARAVASAAAEAAEAAEASDGDGTRNGATTADTAADTAAEVDAEPIAVADDVAPSDEPEPEPEPDPATAAEPIPADVPVLLEPVAATPLATSTEIEQSLELRLRLIGARVALAIADAWDTGRLTRGSPLSFPYAEEVAGILRLAQGLAGEALSSAAGHVRAIEAMVAGADRGRGVRMTPLDILARDFDLSPVALATLLVAAGPRLRGDYARLYGILTNDPSRPLIDELLITHVLGQQLAAEIGRELDADRPLRKYGLLAIGAGARPFAAISVDPLIVRFLANQSAEGEPDQFLKVRRANRRLDELQLPRPLVIKAVRYLAQRRDDGAVRVVIRGRTGSGRHSLLAALAARAGRDLGVIDLSVVPREPGRIVAVLETALRRAKLRGLIPVVDGLDLAVSGEDPDARIGVAGVLRHHPGPLALRLPPEAAIPLDPGYLSLELPQRNEIARGESWRIALSRHHIPLPDADDLAARYRVGPGVIERVCEEVVRRPDPPTEPATWVAALDDAVRQHLENRLGASATRVHRLASWADVILPDEVLDSLLELTARVRHRKTVFEKWGFDRSITTARGITALFSGSPGTGKTMVAGAIARDLGLDLYRVDVSRITSKWIGETEKNLGSLFDAAEDGNAMLLFDEADSLFAKRTEVRTSVDRYANMEVNYLLQRLDSFEGIAVLTTNFGSAIDPAFKRRLSFRVTFPFPDEDMREKLWKALLPPEAPVSGPLDFGKLSQRFRLSGGYIRNATLRAAFLAAEEGGLLTQEHLERAIRMEFREIGKLAESGVLE
jgi:hypothetical protein